MEMRDEHQPCALKPTMTTMPSSSSITRSSGHQSSLSDAGHKGSGASSNVREIHSGAQLLAIILRSSYTEPGIHFFTPADLSQQLAYMRHPAGHRIEPHIHNDIAREVTLTQEVLIIRRGVLRVDFYDSRQHYLESDLLRAGDVILLAFGGHGFEVIEEVEMIAIRQGPHAGEADMTRFAPVVAERLVLRQSE
jgi:hypothetical protein